MTIIEFLKDLKSPITKFPNKRLAYALTDGYEVILFNAENQEEAPVFHSDIHTVLHEIMEAHGIENQSP